MRILVLCNSELQRQFLIRDRMHAKDVYVDYLVPDRHFIEKIRGMEYKAVIGLEYVTNPAILSFIQCRVR